MAEVKSLYAEDAGPSVFVDWLVHSVDPSGGISQTRLAEQAGISAANLSRWSRDQYAPSFEVIRKICTALDLPILPAVAKAGLASRIEVDSSAFVPDLAEASLAEMFQEIERRINPSADWYWAPPPSVHAAGTGSKFFVEWLAHRVDPEGEISHIKLAEKAGISATNLSRWTLNQFEPSFEVIRKICDAMSIPILPAIVKAGLVSESEVSKDLFVPNLAEAPLSELFREIQRRIDAAAKRY